MSYDKGELLKQLELHESKERKLYKDTRGFWTIGIGRNISADGMKIREWPHLDPFKVTLTDEQIAVMLDNDVKKFERALDRDLRWWRTLSDVRQRIILDMTFNMGWAPGHPGGFDDFKTTLALIEAGRYREAARAMKQSKWYQQVGRRSKRLVYAMANDEMLLHVDKVDDGAI